MAELFADLLGQPRAVALLESVLVRQRCAPAYLFAGPDGVGRRLATLRFLEGLPNRVLVKPLDVESVRRVLSQALVSISI